MFGLPMKKGHNELTKKSWDLIKEFIDSEIWKFPDGPLKKDSEDPLLKETPNYGFFLLGFDFHIDRDGVPKLIEINTNAGGLASVIHLSCCELESDVLKDVFYEELVDEHRKFRPDKELRCIAIVDDDVEQQFMYSEMLALAAVLRERSGGALRVEVCSPESLSFDAEREKLLFESEVPVDLVYNRTTDFRMEGAAHAALRAAAVAGAVALTPHPAAYVRVADKRNLTRLPQGASPVVLGTYELRERPISKWIELRKGFVFKPPDGNASKGVYRGDKISKKTLEALPPDTMVQEYVPPPVDALDQTKFDVRVFTNGTKIMGIVSRHFAGQVMEMKSEKSGVRRTLPEGVCCFPAMYLEDFFCDAEKK